MKQLKKNKVIVTSKSQAKRVAIQMGDPCMCRTHLLTDKTLATPIPCLGHGKGCPCTELLEQQKKQPKEQEAK